MILLGILILSILALFAASIPISIGIARRAGRRTGTGMLILKVMILFLAGLLLWQVFMGGSTIRKEIPDPSGRSSHVVVLQDKSRSMDFLASRSTSRDAMAEKTWQQVTAQCRAMISNQIEVSRLYFGGNLVDENNLARLNPDNTRLNNAVIKTITEKTLDALLVVSDGATEDGAIPKFLSDNLASRNISVYAVVAGVRTQEVFDVAVRNVLCNRLNPSKVNASIACTGKGIGSFPLTFSIDGSRVTQVTCDPQPLQTVTFDVPAETTVGWHYFEVSIPPLDGEITASNNVLRGSFHTDTKGKFLFVMDAPPRSENVQLVRLLKEFYPESFETISLESKKLNNMNPLDWRFIVVSDVAPSRLPPAWLEAIKTGALPMVLLAGKHLPEWQNARMPNFPVSGSLQRLQMSKENEAPGIVDTDEFAEFIGTTNKNYGRLPLGVMPSAPVAQNSVTILSARGTDGRHYPLIVTDSKPYPSVIVFLIENTWKWAIHFDPAVRTGFQSLLGDLFQWIHSTVSSSALSLELPEEHGRVVEAQISVNDKTTAVPIEKIKLQFFSEGNTYAVQPARKGNLWQLLIDAPGRTGVIWLQAVAETPNGKLMSERRPLLPPVPPRELRYTELEPATLQSLCETGKNSCGYYSDSGQVISNMLNRRHRHKEETVTIYQRNTPVELMLTFALILLLMIDWWVERRARGKMAA